MANTVARIVGFGALLLAYPPGKAEQANKFSLYLAQLCLNLRYFADRQFLRFSMVGIIMGSLSDQSIMQEAANVLTELGVAWEMDIVSAHRTPEKMVDYAKTARSRGLRVLVAGAGGAAHLPGMVASLTTLPVIGVPVKSSNSIDGWDSVLSILQMPAGVPVATMALNGARNAGILAAQILGTSDETVAQRLSQFKDELKEKVADMSRSLLEKPV
jgi:5-(carboxyamino)imidazole ribonucleotide mutase